MPKHSLYQSNADKRFPHRWLVRSDWLCYLSWLGAWWEPNEPITSFEPKTHKNWVLILLGIVAALPIQLRLLPPSLREVVRCVLVGMEAEAMRTETMSCAGIVLELP